MSIHTRGEAMAVLLCDRSTNTFDSAAELEDLE